MNTIPVKEVKNYFVVPGLSTMHIRIDRDKIINTVCEYYHVKREDILKKSRKQLYVFPRQVCAYFLREMGKYTWYQIQEFLSMNNHSSCLQQHKVIDEMINLYPEKRREIDYIRGLLL